MSAGAYDKFTNAMACSDVILTKFHGDESLRVNLAADFFCQRCTAFLSEHHENSASYSIPWPHSKLGDIHRFAANGCHFCALLLRCIQEASRDENAEIPILLFIKSSILRIQVGSDAARHTPLLRLEHTSSSNGLQSIREFRQNICGGLLTKRTLSQLAQWINECSNNHVHCRAKARTKMPTRLLHISADNIFLVESNSKRLSNLQYITMSHRWPKSPGLKLTKSSRPLFEQGITLETLPPLFRDLCKLSAALGFSYAWIDALCIVQDNEQDWVKEASSMTDVYVNSQLNVIAGASQQDQNLLPERNPLMLTPCVITGSKLSQALNFDGISMYSSDETDQIARLATDSRAWILQECELSPRMVYFGDTEFIWECSTNLQCESSREGGVNWFTTAFANDPRNIRSRLARFRQDYIGLSEARCQSIWTGLVSKYTSLDVTFEIDRLVAISGLSQYLQREVRDQLGEYRAGMWEIGFEQQLMWRSFVESGVTMPSTYLAPSWSWASHVSRIAYHGSPAGAGSVSSFLEDLKISVTPVTDSGTHGRLKDGHFTCLANLCLLQLEYDQFSNCLSWSVELSASGSAPSTRTPLSISVSLDHPNQIHTHVGSSNTYRGFVLVPLLCYDVSDYGQPYLCRPRNRRLFTTWQLENDGEPTSRYVFPKGRWRSPSEPEDHYAMTALVLSPVAGRNGHYTRAGIAEFDSPETIRSLQQACRQTPLPSELYVKAVHDLHAYEIVVI